MCQGVHLPELPAGPQEWVSGPLHSRVTVVGLAHGIVFSARLSRTPARVASLKLTSAT
jgi:hypothetical protein